MSIGILFFRLLLCWRNNCFVVFVVFSRSLAEVENTSTVQKDDRIMEMKRNVEGKDNRIIELESRYCAENTWHDFKLLVAISDTTSLRLHQVSNLWIFCVHSPSPIFVARLILRYWWWTRVGSHFLPALAFSLSLTLTLVSGGFYYL